jgi:DNA-binding GntR family transcriptional regulator
MLLHDDNFIYKIYDMVSPVSSQPAAADAAISVREFVRGALERGLRDGTFAPGAKLKPVVLAATWRVSATPVREALIDLVGAGLVLPSVRRGFRAAPLLTSEAGELYPLIWTLESLAVREAPPTRDDLADLDAINVDLEAADAQHLPDVVLELDAAWHRRLTLGCGNATLRAVLDDLRRRVYRYESVYVRESGAMHTSVTEHRAIAAALRRHNTDRAAALLEQNWRKGLQFIVTWLEHRGASSGGGI